MAEVKALRGLLYNPEKVQDLQAVMAPPYDVISPEFQDRLIARDSHNIVKLILGHTSDRDTDSDNRYTRAAADLKGWLEDGTLLRDEKPALYLYAQSYTITDLQGASQTRTRTGFIGTVKLEELGSGKIHPHEKTLSGPKADRLSLMKACNANLSCIFSIYPEATSESAEASVSSASTSSDERVTAVLEAAVSGDPIIDVVGDDGVSNKLWRIDDEAALAKVSEIMKEKNLFIADGHHRYETALNYRNYMRKTTGKDSGNEPFDYVMMYLASMDDEGMDIFPTHRALHSMEELTAADFIGKCSAYFETEVYQFTDANEAEVRANFMASLNEEADGKTSFGLYVRGHNAYIVLTLRDNAVMDEFFDADTPEVYKHLDVTVLHSLVLTKILGISVESQEKQENLKYIKGLDEAFKVGQAEGTQAIFFMNATTVDEVKSVSEAGLLMPQKSTYFYPKILSGLTINPLWD
jgi:uncharacterized protein (DUF1015 family)